MQDIRIRLSDCWAKTDPVTGEPVVPVTEHLLNSWAVGKELSHSVASCAPFLKLLEWCCALHDIGKISLGFLSKSPKWLEAMGLVAQSQAERWTTGLICDNHGRFTGKHLLQEGSQTAEGYCKLAVLVASHHGRMLHRNDCLSALEHPNHSERMAALRRECHEWLHEQTGIPKEAAPASIPFYDGSLFALAGWTTICDWIASNTDFFPAGEALTAAEARDTAQKALHRLGWFKCLTRGELFQDVFPADDPPRPLQTKLAELAREPGIYIVEAQMGDGKTKAALWAAHGLIKNGKARGLYFALPTQVTSERIREEAVIPFVENGFGPDHAVRLLHSMAWLKDGSAIPRFLNSGSEADGQSLVEDWFAGRRRSLLAPFAVGTIDQALIGVLPRKHFFVRIAGLSGKVVILDEVHSYDIYTGTLIRRLIEFLSRCGSTIIILSATLASWQRKALLEAAGVCEPEETTEDASGTRITWAPWKQRGRNPGGLPAARVDHCEASFTPRTIRVVMSETKPSVIAEDLVRRAASGQKVLWIRNSVGNALEAFNECATNAQESGRDVPCGILHSRFTWSDRQANENKWIGEFQTGPESGGRVLVATQVAEQSLNLDADFLVSDIAPTDLLLQRIGRLWRYRDRGRPEGCVEPSCRIITPCIDPGGGAGEIRKALAPLARVYDPYVLLRTLDVWKEQESILLPGQIRALVDQTYENRGADAEPFPSWAELAAENRRKAKAIEDLAAGLTDVWQRISLEDDDEDAQTRRILFPTVPLVLLRRRLSSPRSDQWVFANGCELKLPDEGCTFPLTLPFRRAVLENSVKIPQWLLPKNENWFPRELGRFRGLNCAVAWLHGERVIPWGETDPIGAWLPGFIYRPAFGLSLPKAAAAASGRSANPWEPDEDDW